MKTIPPPTIFCTEEEQQLIRSLIPASWHVPPPKRKGSYPVSDLKKMWSAIKYIVFTGTPWHRLSPSVYGIFGTSHRYFLLAQRHEGGNIIEKVWPEQWVKYVEMVKARPDARKKRFGYQAECLLPKGEVQS